MEWQTDLTVSQGFLVFNGIKTTKLIKRWKKVNINTWNTISLLARPLVTYTVQI
jgi:hypothetical protein